MNPPQAPLPVPSRVIVIGAAQSVGREIASRFASIGARVHACDIDDEGLAELSAGSIITHKLDALDPVAVETVLRGALAELGGIDVLVVTVGLPGPRAPLEEVSYAEWETSIRGSAGAAFFAIK